MLILTTNSQSKGGLFADLTCSFDEQCKLFLCKLHKSIFQSVPFSLLPVEKTALLKITCARLHDDSYYDQKTQLSSAENIL